MKRPLVWLGVAEVSIGVTALLTPSGLEVLQQVYAGVHPSVRGSEATLLLVRLLMSFAVLIVPSALMGATLLSRCRAIAILTSDSCGATSGVTSKIGHRLDRAV